MEKTNVNAAQAGAAPQAGDFLSAIYSFATVFPGGITADTLFDQRTEGIVASQAARLVQTGAFPPHERDDVAQILRLALLHEMSDFNPALGGRYVFAANVVANYGKNLLAKRSRELEETGGRFVSLEALGESDALVSSAPDPAEMAETADSVGRLMASLDGLDREICRLVLEGYSVREISKKLRRARSHIDWRIAVHVREKALACGVDGFSGGAR